MPCLRISCGRGRPLLRSRRLLTKTPEWNSAEERVRVAADCDARGSAYLPLALVMRGRENCSALRKGHLLHLARVWGYASHLWCVARAASGGWPRGLRRLAPAGASATTPP